MNTEGERYEKKKKVFLIFLMLWPHGALGIAPTSGIDGFESRQDFLGKTKAMLQCLHDL
jgi:hypothetical protein